MPDSSPSIQDQIQQSVDTAIPPGPSQFNGQGPADPNAPPYAPPPGTPGVATSTPLPASLIPTPQQQQEADQRAFHAQVAREEQQAVAADVTKHAVFGKAVKSMLHSLNGTQTRYQANPETGQIEEITVPASRGQFFKNLLSAAVIGAAAGAGGEGPNAHTFTGGFSRGVAANMQLRQRQDELQYQRAQNNLKGSMDREKLDDDEVYHNALVAHENQQTADLLHNQHLADQKLVESHNAASRAYQQFLVDSGALPAKLTIGGKLLDSVDGTSFVKAYIQDPSIAKAPTGFQRHFFSTTDLSELHYDGGQWVDDSGNPINLGGRIDIKAYDMPTSTFKTPKDVKGSVINAARGQHIVNDDDTYSVTPEAMSGLYTIGTKEKNETLRANKNSNAKKERDKLNRAMTQIESKKAAALAKAEHNYWVANSKGDAGALDELNTAKQQAQDAYEAEIKAAGGRVLQHVDYGSAPAPQAGVSQIFSPTKWKAANPTGDVNAAIDQAKKQWMAIGQ
jgi:hypothetical protein